LCSGTHPASVLPKLSILGIIAFTPHIHRLSLLPAALRACARAGARPGGNFRIPPQIRGKKIFAPAIFPAALLRSCARKRAALPSSNKGSPGNRSKKGRDLMALK